ncbi:hypothetical protein EZI54_11365 [Marinobacter halodurans]|uniref:Uncharacterized protein n=1 Tax=Marinobacter halodurans TaxID=2528979 RepID=A0ABY1ZK24_9GAMM|nr:hypothetical protein [Marinobacter halodurans]TBW55760.1 hypothetical protein EZI54_11365 [Marinobacter halodurans]
MQCLIIDDLISAEGKINHPRVAEFYEAYVQRQRAAGRPVLEPRDWPPYARGAAYDFLFKLLGENIRRGGRTSLPVLLDLAMIPRPSSMSPERVSDLLRFLTRADNAPKTWERLSRFDDSVDAVTELLATERRVSRAYLNILKGNLAEVFSMPEQLRTLVRIKETHPDAVLLAGVRIIDPSSGASRLFSDNIIARWRSNGNLEVLSVFEIKSGYRGGGEAQEQIFEWIEGRIEEGFQLHLPRDARYYDIPRGQGTSAIVTRNMSDDIEVLVDNADQTAQMGRGWTYVYDPAGHQSGPRVISLVSSDRQVITASGASQMGLNPSLGVAQGSNIVELGISSAELDFLAGQLFLAR